MLRHHLAINFIFVLTNSINNSDSIPRSVKSIISNSRLSGVHNIIGKIINYDDSYKVIVYANKENIEILKNNKILRDSEIDNYEKIIENQSIKYNELSRKFDNLKERLYKEGYYVSFDSNGNIIIFEERGE